MGDQPDEPLRDAAANGMRLLRDLSPDEKHIVTLEGRCSAALADAVSSLRHLLNLLNKESSSR